MLLEKLKKITFDKDGNIRIQVPKQFTALLNLKPGDHFKCSLEGNKIIYELVEINIVPKDPDAQEGNVGSLPG